MCNDDWNIKLYNFLPHFFPYLQTNLVNKEIWTIIWSDAGQNIQHFLWMRVTFCSGFPLETFGYNYQPKKQWVFF